MQCKNHPDVPSADRCAGCAEGFCGDCLVEVLGQKYCNSCKVLATQGRQVVVEEATTPCPEAGEALRYAIFSLFCCGFILGPVAIAKAVKARQIIADDPRLTGYGKANAALAIGIIGLVLWLIATVARALHPARRF